MLWSHVEYSDIYDPKFIRSISICRRLTPTRTKEGLIVRGHASTRRLQQVHLGNGEAITQHARDPGVTHDRRHLLRRALRQRGERAVPRRLRGRLAGLPRQTHRGRLQGGGISTHGLPRNIAASIAANGCRRAGTAQRPGSRTASQGTRSN